MDWNSSILWGIISIIATIIFGYFFYTKSIKIKTLYISVDSKTLISKSFTKYKGLSIYYNKKNIKKLVSSTISIKNIGNETIEVSDIAPSSPITFSTTKNFLLTDIKDYEIYKTNNNISSSLNKISNSELEFSFDFIKPQDEIFVTLLHNGNITISGDLKNGDMYIDNQKYDRRKRINRMKITIFISFLFLLFFNTVAIITLFILRQ